MTYWTSFSERIGNKTQAVSGSAENPGELQRIQVQRGCDKVEPHRRVCHRLRFLCHAASGYIINSILKAIFPGRNLIVLVIVLAIASAIGIVAFCKRMEKKCLMRDMPKSTLPGDMTDEEKQEFLHRIPENRKS